MEPHAGQRFASPAPQFKSKRLIALGTAVLFLPAALLAQQAPYYPGPQQPDSQQYEQEVPPPPDEPQSGYDQPRVAPVPEIQPGYGQQAPPPPDYSQPQSGYDQSEPQPGYTQQQQPLNAPQLEQLVAPVALNPDSLIALMLAASTYPSQVAAAAQWRQTQGNASPDQIAYGASLQAWDPSVKALTAFPQVLDQMAGNMQWTSALGAAYYNQPQDVLQAVQVMRQRAQAAGNLQSTPQETVTDNQGYIAVAPANPQVVYVPQYDPWVVYGQPVAPYPGYSFLDAFGGVVQFGVGTVLSAFAGAPWGFFSWGLNWFGDCLFFNHADYYSHSHMVADWGLRYGGPRAWGAPRHSFVAYNRNFGYGRGYGSSRGYGYQSYGRNYSQGYRGQNGYAGNLARPAYGRTYQPSASGYRGAQAYNRYGSGFNSNYRTSPYSNYRQQSPFANHSTYANRTMQAYNRSPETFRSQQYSRGAYGSTYSSGFASTMRSSNDLRRAYGNSYQGSRSPYGGGFNQRSNGYSNFSRPSSGNRGFNQQPSAYRSFSGNGFANYGRSSGSRGFLGGGNHTSFGSSQSFKAPHFSQPHYSAPHFSASQMHGGGGGGGHFGGGGGGGHHGGGGGGGHHR
jgi:hypothetical protein